MSNLPKNWEMATMSAVARLVRGVNYYKDQARSTASMGMLPVLRANNIDGVLNFNKLVYVPKKQISEEQLVRKGDIIIAMSSGSKQLVGKAAQALRDFNGGFGAFCGLIRPSPEIEAKYLGYFFQTENYRRGVSAVSAGVNINNLRRQHIESIKVPVAPRSEQRRITAEIEKHFTRLEAGISSLKRVQANLKRYRAAILKAACQGQLCSGKGLPFKKQPLGNLGKWSGGGTPSKANLVFWTSGKIPWVSPKDMKAEIISDSEDHITKAAVEHSATNLIPAKAVLIVTRSGILQHTFPVAVTTRPVTINQDLKALQVSPDYDNRYIALALRAHEQEILQQCTKTGTTVHNVEFPAFLRFEIPAPPLPEQKKIVAEVERRLSVVDELEGVVKLNLTRATRMRQAVLQQAFSGAL